MKSFIQNIVNTCLIATRNWGGCEVRIGSTIGFTDAALDGSRMGVTVASAGFVIPPDAGLHIYYV